MDLAAVKESKFGYYQLTSQTPASDERFNRWATLSWAISRSADAKHHRGLGGAIAVQDLDRPLKGFRPPDGGEKSPKNNMSSEGI